MRQALSIILPLLAPTLIYLYLKNRGGTPARIAAKDAPWVWLAAAGMAAFGVLPLLSGETLKYSNAGRSQLYVLTIAICVVLLGLFMSWSYLPHFG